MKIRLDFKRGCNECEEVVPVVVSVGNDEQGGFGQVYLCPSCLEAAWNMWLAHKLKSVVHGSKSKKGKAK
jgi:hypothetical protein